MKKILKKGFTATFDKMIMPGVAVAKTLVGSDTNCFIAIAPVVQEGVKSYYGAGYYWLATTATGVYTGKLNNPLYVSASETPTVNEKIFATYATIESAIEAYTISEGRTLVSGS